MDQSFLRGERSSLERTEIENVPCFMFSKLDTSHVEMFELNTVAPRNTAESKKSQKRKERETQREKQRGEVREKIETTFVKILEQKKKKMWGNGRRERGRCKEKR